VTDAYASTRLDPVGNTSIGDTSMGDASVGPMDKGLVLRLWNALRDVEDPEIPVSLVDMGLIVSIDYVPERKTAHLSITYTAMGCPAMDMIQDDIRARLLREAGVERVEIEVVWDPLWTAQRLSQQARGRMRELGLGV
jgi:metal-sulfur cluster biosynthetic enzyme